MAKTFSPSQAKGRPSTAGLVGTVEPGVTGLTVEEFGSGDGQNRVTKFTFTNFTITNTDAAGAGSYGSQKLYDFPTGSLALKNGYASFTSSSSSTNLSGTVKFSLGTAAEATGDTLDSTQANAVVSTSTTAGSSTPGKGYGAAPSIVNGTGTAADLYLNMGASAGDSAGAATVTVNGYAIVEWSVLA